MAWGGTNDAATDGPQLLDCLETAMEPNGMLGVLAVGRPWLAGR